MHSYLVFERKEKFLDFDLVLPTGEKPIAYTLRSASHKKNKRICIVIHNYPASATRGGEKGRAAGCVGC